MADMKLKVARGFKAGTRIQSIEVPAALRVKRTSGIEWFDDALGGEGGFTPTTTMMVTGGPGCGKSTLIRQLADSMTKAGHVVVLNCGEESLFQAKMACERLGLKQNFMVAEETMLPKLLTFMDNVKADPKHKGKQIVVLQDSLQTLDDGKYVDNNGDSRGTNSMTPVRVTEDLVSWTQENFAISAFVGQVGKSGEFLGKNTIKHAIDTHFHLWYDEKEKSETYGSLIGEVQKNRWGCNAKSYLLTLTKTGIEEQGSFNKAGRKARPESKDEEAA
jgi:DNA repair protein RadA/Sms